MLFYNTLTKEYPRFIGDMELLGWSIGQELPDNWVEVTQVEYPVDFDENFKVVENEPIEISGTWTQNFSVVPMTDEEIAVCNAPKTAKAKLLSLGLSQIEVDALMRGLIR